MIAFQCPKCKASFKTTDDKAGLRSKCPKCGSVVQVPRQPGFTSPAVTEVRPVKLPATIREVPEVVELPPEETPYACMDSDDAPAKMPQGTKIAIVSLGIGVLGVGVLALIIAIVVLSKAQDDGWLGGGGGTMKIGVEKRFGDLGVTVARADVVWVQVQMRASGRMLQNQGKGFGVGLKFVNHNPNKRLYVQGQAGRARMSDDVGNIYENLVIGNELGIPGRLCEDIGGVGCYKQIMKDEQALVRSDQPAYDYFAFAEPVEGARALTVTLDAGCWGGRGTYVVKLRRIGTPGFLPDWRRTVACRA